MFSENDILARIRERPFKPVRFVTTTGQTYDVYHPDLIMVGRREVIIGTASAENPATFEMVTRISLLHVTELRDLPVSVQAPSGNGET
jgi:hypothetical protein